MDQAGQRKRKREERNSPVRVDVCSGDPFSTRYCENLLFRREGQAAHTACQHLPRAHLQVLDAQSETMEIEEERLLRQKKNSQVAAKTIVQAEPSSSKY